MVCKNCGYDAKIFAKKVDEVSKIISKQRVEKANEIGFTQGVGYSIALLKRSGIFDSHAEYIANECGLTLEDFKKGKIGGYDLVEIKKVFKEGVIKK